ncbi:MAG: hypothetical protein V4501_11890 [Pseudomonadota bacterium]
MINKPKVFILKPKIKQDEFREIIIWSNDENTARKNATTPSLAAPKGMSEAMTMEDLNFYTRTQNATCEELQVQIEKQNNKIYFEYNNKHYELIENDSEEVQV